MGHSFKIRPAVVEDLPALPEIERGAATLFFDRIEELGLSPEKLAQNTSDDHFLRAQEEGHLWVAAEESDQLVGFVMVRMVDRLAHLKEVDVLPAHGRRGIGKGLVLTVCSWAKDRGIPAVTLSTFRDVPWNAPFYMKLGFEVVSPADISPGHEELMLREKERGLRPDLRVLMQYRTAGR